MSVAQNDDSMGVPLGWLREDVARSLQPGAAQTAPIGASFLEGFIEGSLWTFKLLARMSLLQFWRWQRAARRTLAQEQKP